MSSQSFAAEQLLELLLQLKKTTPTAARQILNGQPQIAYALMTLMVSMNAVNFDVFQKTLAEYGNNKPVAPPSAPPSLLPSTSSTPVPAIPQHIQASPQFRTNTPPSMPPQAPPTGYGYQGVNGHTAQQSLSQPGYNAGYGPSNSGYGYNQPPAGYPGYPSHYGAPPPAAAPPPTIPDALSAIPDDQKALIMRVLSMSPEQIHMLPPNERATFIQLRATLGAPIS
ncbi:hypothetical protein BDZ94DRAFT_1313643 [Collybia nuda]|uniref:Cleavage stimulation factor subunit 2 hinge domain-containing protein n=1 Tax=Collybia nuda TaxID=64659 RepID=A0A9P5XS02_9AGAR|nr:hypothetical protein BDZ94DRAFT_1241483 [Collybia nuda]KAF9458048.1 hypothetical protein BDZ94DRAFT_1313643 [Collybia nuda]